MTEFLEGKETLMVRYYTTVAALFIFREVYENGEACSCHGRKKKRY